MSELLLCLDWAQIPKVDTRKNGEVKLIQPERVAQNLVQYFSRDGVGEAMRNASCFIMLLHINN